jgi:hypothetical protein
VLGVILGFALAATAVWLALLLTRNDQPSQATPPPPTAAATTSPTQTTTAPAFTKDGAVAGLRIIVRKRQEMLRTLDESILSSLYTSDCRLADGSSCLKSDQQTLRELRAKDAHLKEDPITIRDIRIESWEPQGRTAVMKLIYDLRIGRFVNSKGIVVETEPAANRVVDQVTLSGTALGGGRPLQRRPRGRDCAPPHTSRAAEYLDFPYSRIIGDISPDHC